MFRFIELTYRFVEANKKFIAFALLGGGLLLLALMVRDVDLDGDRGSIFYMIIGGFVSALGMATSGLFDVSQENFVTPPKDDDLLPPMFKKEVE